MMNTMITKKDLMNMIKDFDDDAVLMFVGEDLDRDGFPYDITKAVYKVLDANRAELVKKDYGIKRYEMVK